MRLLAECLVALVALLHLYFLVLEMFLWDKPLGLKTFRQTPEHAAISKTLAANQGLYNGFLVAGLVWGLVVDAHASKPILIFFLSCVVVAGPQVRHQPAIGRNLDAAQRRSRQVGRCKQPFQWEFP